jgi:hypothetical protein
MTRRYVHFSARDLEDAILELHGLKITTNDTSLAKLMSCPRCSVQNPLGNVRCAACGMILDKETALRFEETQNQKETQLQEKNLELQKRLEKLEGTISALLTTTSGKF